jgi:hypothetical protein
MAPCVAACSTSASAPSACRPAGRRYWGVGFNPFRAQKRRSSDYVFLAAALGVTLLLLLWALNP